jgi:thiol-disulfide isomerase/thioredoxin
MTGHKRHSPRVRRRATAAAATAAAAALLLSACGSDSDGGGASGAGSGTNFVTSTNGIATVAEGDRHAAPRLQGKTLDGGQLDTADFKGEVVVLNVWGSWCAPCRAEAKNFVKVAEETKDQGVQFVGINTRDTSTQPALAFEKEEGIEYPSLYDPTGRLLLRFEKGTLNPQAIPTTLVIDREGKIAARAMQPLSEEKLRDMLDPVLAEK